MEKRFRKKWDVIVVGAGFVGNYAAKHLAARGLDTLVLEEHKKIGTPRHCAGLISISGLEKLHLKEKIQNEGGVRNEIRNAILTGFDGDIKRKVTRDKSVAYVVDRVKLDRLVYRQAKEKGAIYHLGSRVYKLEKNGKVHIQLDDEIKKTLKAKAIVDAEGPRRALIRSLTGVDLTHRLPGLQVDVTTEEQILQEDTVEIIFNLPDFFSWIIPLGEDIYRFGLASWEWKSKLRYILSNLIKKRTKSYEKIREFGGVVLTGGPMERTVWGKILALGDAAGWPKPTTGGGVVFGGLTAKMVSEEINEAIRREHSFTSVKEIKRTYKKEFNMMQLVRATLNFLGPGGIQIVLKIIPQRIFTKLKGDYDFQFETFLKLLFPLLFLLND